MFKSGYSFSCNFPKNFEDNRMIKAFKWDPELEKGLKEYDMDLLVDIKDRMKKNFNLFESCDIAEPLNTVALRKKLMSLLEIFLTSKKDNFKEINSIKELVGDEIFSILQNLKTDLWLSKKSKHSCHAAIIFKFYSGNNTFALDFTVNVEGRYLTSKSSKKTQNDALGTVELTCSHDPQDSQGKNPLTLSCTKNELVSALSENANSNEIQVKFIEVSPETLEEKGKSEEKPLEILSKQSEKKESPFKIFKRTLSFLKKKEKESALKYDTCSNFQGKDRRDDTLEKLPGESSGSSRPGSPEIPQGEPSKRNSVLTFFLEENKGRTLTISVSDPNRNGQENSNPDDEQMLTFFQALRLSTKG